MNVSTNGSATFKYFRQSLLAGDFDLGEDATRSLWCGDGAKRLGLEGVVDAKSFRALCHNVDPHTGEQLTPRMVADRRVGYDFNLHVPKGVSICIEVVGDDALMGALIDANEFTMAEVERAAETRVRRGGVNEDRVTSNLVRARFVHRTSRPINGIPDAHDHVHNFVFNSTFDAVEGRWKALQLGSVMKNAPYYQEVFLSDLARRVQALGYGIRECGNAWDIAGISPEIAARYSRRTGEINEEATRRGMRDPESKARLGAWTRRPKSASRPWDDVRQEWKERLTPEELHDLSHLKGDRELLSDRSIAEAVRFAVLKTFERSAVVPETALLSEVLRASPGKAMTGDIQAELQQHGIVVRDLGGRRMVTTREVLAEEKRLVDLARDGRGSRRGLTAARAMVLPFLGEQEQQALEHMLFSTDLVTLVRVRGFGQGALLLRATREAFLQDAKITPWAFSATGAATSGELRQAGFSDAATVARLLKDEKPQREAAKGVWIVTEAHRLTIKTALDLIELGKRSGARVVLMGDSMAKGSIFRGNPLHSLEKHAGLSSVSVDAVRRQDKQHAGAIEALNAGFVRKGLDLLQEMGAVKSAAEGEAFILAGREFAKRASSQCRTLIVSPTPAGVEAATKAARAALVQKRKIRKERTFARLKRRELTAIERTRASLYGRGMVVEFTRKHGRFKARERWTVTGQNLLGKIEIRNGIRLGTLPLNRADCFDVFEPEDIKIGVGDYVRITRSGWTRAVIDIPLGLVSKRRVKPSRRLEADSVHRVREFTLRGHLVLDNGFILKKSYGHIDYGYAKSIGSSMPHETKHVICVQPSDAAGANSVEQLARAVSIGSKSASVIAEPGALERLRDVDGPRPSALDLTGGRYEPGVREIVSDSLDRLAKRTFGIRTVSREFDHSLER